jgi:hypothetical protein
MLGITLANLSPKDTWVIVPLVIDATLLAQLTATDQVGAENPVGWEKLMELVSSQLGFTKSVIR